MSQDVPATKSRNWVRLTGDFLLKTAMPIVLGVLVTLSSFSSVSTKISDSLLKTSMDSQGKIAQLENRADGLRETLAKVKAWQDSINPLIADEKLKAGLHGPCQILAFIQQ